MKINLTKKEYRLLVETLYLAEWIMHSHEIQSTHKEHVALKKKIFSHYKEMGAEDIINHEKESDEYYELAKFDEKMHQKFITDYNDKIFWDELLERLAERDVIMEVGLEKYHSMDLIDKGITTDKVKARYAAEFEEHGLKNIIIKSG